MTNPFIKELMNGKENGSFLALDLGGTNFRVILIQITDGIFDKEEVEYYNIPKHLFTEEGTKLYDFIAISIEHFLTNRGANDRHYDLGFTFSFPMHLEAIDVAIHTSWTKSFSCPGVIGKNVRELLSSAIQRKTNLDISVTCVTNDCIATLVYGSYFDKRCAIGLIMGTGNNACYIENTSNIHKWKDTERSESAVVLEWGAFGDNGVLDFLRTKWDRIVDKKSVVKRTYTFEKCLAGKYLGCLVREALVTLAQEGLFCKGSTELLETHEHLKTSQISKIEAEAFRDELFYTKDVLSSYLELEDVTDDDARIAQYVCGLVSYRAALLLSLVTSMLLNRMDRPHCTIAVDGSLFVHHPRFKPLMELLIEQNAPGKSFSFLTTKDGSGKGAGLVAAIENRIRNS
ncbi:Hexokinase type 2 [Armadillidium vulgare]|nr:Hexokinase type 2 [Armadillidium vulgare]